MVNKNTVLEFLNRLGFKNEESLVYTTLVANGPLTALRLARETGINRTKIYRLVEILAKRGVVEEVVEEHQRLARAVGPHKLELLLKEREANAKLMREVFPEVTQFITTSTSASDPQTKVLFYRGQEGIKQQVWNTLSAKKECVGYTYRVLSEITGLKFAIQWKEEFIRRNLFFRDIISDEHLASEKRAPKEYLAGWPKARFKSRYLPSRVLNVNHQIDIYNDVVSFYNWYEGEVFGVEIYNQKISHLQKQMFEIIWKQAKEIEF